MKRIFMLRVLLSLSLLSPFTFHLSPIHGAPGKTSANYLKVDVGAKGVALAGTQFAAENDSFAPFYNPALLSGANQKEIGFMHNEFIEDLRQEFLSYVHPTLKRGNFGAALNYFSYGKIAGYDATGSPTGNVSASDLMLSGSWGKKWDFTIGETKFDNFSAGAGLKILNRKLHNDSAMGVALDLGFAYPLTYKYLQGIKIAGSYANLGTQIKSSDLPRTGRFGVTYSHWGDVLTVNLDQLLTSDAGAYPIFGIQYKPLKIFSVRLGYKANKYLEQKFTYGVGFENPLLRLDYSFIPFGDLGDTHRISVVYRFGKSTGRPAADAQLRTKVQEAKALYAQGLLVDAYLACTQVQRVAPWVEENNKLLEKIQKDFRELEDSNKKEKMKLQVDSIFARGEKFFEEGNLINAQLEFQAVLGLEPDHKAAQGYIRQIEGQFRSFVESFYRAGMIAFADENYVKAKEEFEKVLVIKHDHQEAQAQLAKCIEMLDKQQREKAEAVQKDIVSKTYKDGLDAYRKENFEEALSRFEQVLKIAPQHDEAQRYAVLARETLFKQYLAAGKDLMGKGQWEGAIRNLKKAVDSNPSSDEADSLLQDAQRRWELQRKVVSQNLYKEGLEAFLAGDKSKAKTVWQRAIELDPENEEAKRGLSRLGQ